MDKFVSILRDHFGSNLLSVGLHNLGVTSFLKKNGIFVVLNEVYANDILSVKNVYSKYKKKYSTPLVVDKDFFRKSATLFCMEILELKENAIIIYGTNPFVDLDINNDDLKKQILYELSSKLLSLKGAFMDLPLDKKVIDDLAYRSLYSLLLILRNILRIKGILINDETLIEKFEQYCNIKLYSFKELINSPKIGFDKLFEIFKRYLDDVEKLVKISDSII